MGTIYSHSIVDILLLCICNWHSFITCISCTVFYQIIARTGTSLALVSLRYIPYLCIRSRWKNIEIIPMIKKEPMINNYVMFSCFSWMSHLKSSSLLVFLSSLFCDLFHLNDWKRRFVLSSFNDELEHRKESNGKNGDWKKTWKLNFTCRKFAEGFPDYLKDKLWSEKKLLELVSILSWNEEWAAKFFSQSHSFLANESSHFKGLSLIPFDISPLS